MATNHLSDFLQNLRRAALRQDGAGLTDGQLLTCFIELRDEAAIAALVRRHSPMVWGVCRRVLASHHDAEDAFQATFLVLVRKAASVAPRELVGNWLYGVAHQTALKARATAARRQARERLMTAMPEREAAEQDLWDDLQPLLDRELSRLPDKYRAPIVLCDLGGKTRKEAAGQLGVPEGTLAARLARGRVMLAKRLARQGLALSGGSLALLLARNATQACASPAVMASTIKAAALYAAGSAAAAGATSANAAALTEGVLKSMLLAKLKVATAVILVTAATVAGVGQLTYQALPQRQGATRAEDELKRVAGGAPRAEDTGAKTDRQKLEGTWIAESVVWEGRRLSMAEIKDRDLKLSLKGDGYKVDPTKMPGEIDLLEGKDTVKGIYRWDGDKLEVCLGARGGERPAAFKSERGTRTFLMTLQRKP
jgi:RNA polymerase sigma factor (sigma-70 family)